MLSKTYQLYELIGFLRLGRTAVVVEGRGVATGFATE